MRRDLLTARGAVSVEVDALIFGFFAWVKRALLQLSMFSARGQNSAECLVAPVEHNRCPDDKNACNGLSASIDSFVNPCQPAGK